MPDQLEKMRTKWDHFGGRFTETANKHMTMQSAQHLHSHMQLDLAHNVLEVAAGAGLGSLDIAQYLQEGRSKVPKETKRTFTATDLSHVMVDMAAKNLSGISSESIEIKCCEANASTRPRCIAPVHHLGISRPYWTHCYQYSCKQRAGLRGARGGTSELCHGQGRRGTPSAFRCGQVQASANLAFSVCIGALEQRGVFHVQRGHEPARGQGATRQAL
uniref:Methyltransferase domain-containing protein n=1 Tax=Hyaloperonospora arabidopsidis (strain Emoy2) TaxID=559515 RepID=M4B7H2_HYAAE